MVRDGPTCDPFWSMILYFHFWIYKPYKLFILVILKMLIVVLRLSHNYALSLLRRSWNVKYLFKTYCTISAQKYR